MLHILWQKNSLGGKSQRARAISTKCVYVRASRSHPSLLLFFFPFFPFFFCSFFFRRVLCGTVSKHTQSVWPKKLSVYYIYFFNILFVGNFSQCDMNSQLIEWWWWWWGVRHGNAKALLYFSSFWDKNCGAFI